MPSVPFGTVPPKIQLRGLWRPPPNCWEANQPATYAPPAKNAT